MVQEELVRRICEMDGENQELVLELARLKEVSNIKFKEHKTNSYILQILFCT